MYYPNGNKMCFCKGFKGTRSPTHRKTYDVLKLFYLRYLMLHLENSSQELFVNAVNKADEGEYWCRATNTMGSAESNRVSVKVLGEYIAFWTRKSVLSFMKLLVRYTHMFILSICFSVPPEFLQSVPSTTIGVLGSSVLIRCKVFGDPIPSVVWYKGPCDTVSVFLSRLGVDKKANSICTSL